MAISILVLGSNEYLTYPAYGIEFAHLTGGEQLQHHQI